VFTRVPLLDLVLNQLNPVHPLTSYFLKNKFNGDTALIEKLIGAQLFMKFHASFGIRRVITAFTGDRQWDVS
jgi:hypothetical protein